MRINTQAVNLNRTHGGAPAHPAMTTIQALRRSVMSCLLWEREFYEDGQEIAQRILTLAAQVEPQVLADLAVEVRHKANLRHTPLLLLVALCKRPGNKLVSETIATVITRPDELTEFLALYWRLNVVPVTVIDRAGRPNKAPLSKQAKLGLAKAFQKFDAYQLAKYNRDTEIKLRDVLFLVHAKPETKEQAATWQQLAAGTLPAPDTWEVALSAGADKKQTWERLLAEGTLGYLALLRNLRNMEQAGVDPEKIKWAILARKGAARVLPFRYVAAARYAPRYERELDTALLASVAALPKFSGRTCVLVDVSGSMGDKLSAKSDLTRLDAACALASMITGDDVRVFSFSDHLVEVPHRLGMAGVDAIKRSQPSGGTAMAAAVAHVGRMQLDRLIVITDEQTTDGTVGVPQFKHLYMVNVASAKNGVGYGRWKHIDGFSENILKWMHAVEQ